MKDFLIIIISAILVENFVLSRFLGICPFLGVSKKLSTALGMGLAVIFVMGIASALTWSVNVLLVRYNLDYLRTISFILVIASIVQFLEIVIKKKMPSLYKSLGIYLPLITTNCAVLGVALLNIDKTYNFFKSIVFGISAGCGFTLALVIFSGIRERFEYSDIPESLKGLPIALIAASLISVAFFGFQGLVSNAG